MHTLKIIRGKKLDRFVEKYQETVADASIADVETLFQAACGGNAAALA